MVRDVEREREIIVTDGGRGTGSVVAAIVGIVLVALVAWLLFAFIGGSDAGDGGAGVPDEVDVNVDTGSGNGG